MYLGAWKHSFCTSHLFLVQYAVHLYSYLKEWLKNPQWTFSCCLALIIPLINLPGEISGLVGTNVLNTQLDTGEMELTTVVRAVQDSGAIDVTLEDGDQEDDSPSEVHEDYFQYPQTQTGGRETPTVIGAPIDSVSCDASLKHSEDDNNSTVQVKNFDDSHIQTGETKTSIIKGVAKDSKTRTVDVILENAEQHGNKPKKVEEDNCNEDQYINKKCHEGTQTELSSVFSIADGFFHQPEEESHF